MRVNIFKAIWPFIWWQFITPILGALRFILIIFGWFILPFAIPFSKKDISNSTSRQEIEILPSWAWLWSNDNDGILGDRRQKWDERWIEFWYPKLHLLSFTKLVSIKPTCFMAKYVWAGWRNPVNNLRFTRFYNCRLYLCNPIQFIGTEKVSDRVGFGGCHLIWAYPVKSIIPYVGYYSVRMWSKSQSKCIRVRMGYKIDSHDVGEVGFTTLIAPWKSVHGA